jgi:hypothetical protein
MLHPFVLHAKRRKSDKTPMPIIATTPRMLAGMNSSIAQYALA